MRAYSKWINNKILFTVCNDAVTFGVIFLSTVLLSKFHDLAVIFRVLTVILIIAIFIYFPFRAVKTVSGMATYSIDEPFSCQRRNNNRAALMDFVYFFVLLLTKDVVLQSFIAPPVKIILIAFISLLSSIEQKRKIIMLISGRYTVILGRNVAFTKRVVLSDGTPWDATKSERRGYLHRHYHASEHLIALDTITIYIAEVELQSGKTVPLCCGLFTVLQSE